MFKHENIMMKKRKVIPPIFIPLGEHFIELRMMPMIMSEDEAEKICNIVNGLALNVSEIDENTQKRESV